MDIDILILILLAVILIIFILYAILKSPYRYPYFRIGFDVSRKRSPDINDLIDSYLNEYGLKPFSQHCVIVKKWKEQCISSINKSHLKKLRKKQYEKIIDDSHMFRFILHKTQTRYKQTNYIRTPYTVDVQVAEYTCDFALLSSRYEALAKINFECTLSQYNTKEQRKLMTSELRDFIARRDNYTCQICGKYMPDGVGLHIDHIIPIKKGGKTVPSNLQVLCSKCNGKKSSN